MYHGMEALVADKTWGVRRGGARAAEVLKLSDEAVLELMLTEALQAEMATWNLERAAFKPGQYGDPFAPCKYEDDDGKTVEHKENVERYRLWPRRKKDLGLLFFLACVVLCAPATSTANESFHSIAGYILRSLRRSLLPEKAAAYSILMKTLPEQLKAYLTPKMKELEAMAKEECFLDTEAVDAALLGDDDAAPLGSAGAAASASAAAAGSSGGARGGAGASDASEGEEEIELFDEDEDEA